MWRQLERVGALVASAAFVLATAGCGQPHPTLAELRKVPEASVVPVGPVLVRRGGVAPTERTSAA